MKRPLQWHKDCLRNRLVWLQRMEDAAARARLQLEDVQRETERLRQQIERAEREGRDGFDAELFGQPRRKKRA